MTMQPEIEEQERESFEDFLPFITSLIGQAEPEERENLLGIAKDCFLLASENYTEEEGDFASYIQEHLASALEKASGGESKGKTRAPSNDDAFLLYMQQVGKYRMLTPEEEKYYGQQVAFLEDENATPEQKEFALAAKNALVNANLRLVVSLARKYQRPGMPILDLIQEGNIGLSRAAEKYDPSKGTRFSTYAHLWIEQAIAKAAAEQFAAIKLPIHKASEIARVKRVADVLAQKLERQPTLEELAEELPQYTPDSLEELFSYSQSVSSANATLQEDSSLELLDAIPDEDEDAAESIEEEETEELVEKGLDLLPPREKEIIILLFGLGGKDPMTLKQVGDIYGVKPERIRQLREQAFARMRKALSPEEEEEEG